MHPRPKTCEQSCSVGWVDQHCDQNKFKVSVAAANCKVSFGTTVREIEGNVIA